MNDEEYKLYLALNERVTDLAKSYRVLNENHQDLQLRFVELKTEIQMTKSIVKWLMSPTFVIALLSLILQLAGLKGMF